MEAMGSNCLPPAAKLTSVARLETDSWGKGGQTDPQPQNHDKGVPTVATDRDE